MPPRFRACPICQQGFGTASLPIHIPQCYEKAVKRWRLDPVGPMPVMPSLGPAPRPGEKKKSVQVACGTGVTGVRSLRKQADVFTVAEYPEDNANLHPCSRCGRKFLYDRIAYHESVCKGDVKRKVFDSSKQRSVVDDDDGDRFGRSYGKKKRETKKSIGTFSASPGVPRTNWREKHREFIEAMRAARGAQKASQAMWGNPLVKEAPSDRRGDGARAPPAVMRHQKGIQMSRQRTSRPIEVSDPKLPIAGRRAPPRRSYGTAFGTGDRFSGTGGFGGGGGGKIINDNTTSLGMLQAFGRA